MNIGERRHRVTFQTGVTTSDDFGEPDQAWDDLCTSWARVMAIKGGEKFSALHAQSDVDYRIVTRNRSELTALAADDRAQWGGMTFDIRAVIPRGHGDSDLEILAKVHR